MRFRLQSKITLKIEPLRDKFCNVVGYKVMRSDGVTFYGKTQDEAFQLAVTFDRRTPKKAVQDLLDKISH